MIANTVKEVISLHNPYSKMILDRGFKINDNFIKEILNRSVMSWKGRKPKLAIDENGKIINSDLDLLSWLMPLALRGAVIEIPEYVNRRKSVAKENERKIGQRRFGKITGLVSNKNMFSFSVQITDNSVVNKNLFTEDEQVGQSRNFMLVDIDGNLRNYGRKIFFLPTAKENYFLVSNNLFAGNEISFRYVVHPNRWQSIFSSQHLLKKMLVARINNEAKFYRSEIARLKKMGLSLPIVKKAKTKTGLAKKVNLTTMEMVLDMPKFIGKYQAVADTIDGLRFASDRYEWLVYTARPLVQFAVRANELAYFKFGGIKVAHWLGGLSWESGFKTSNGRIVWNRLALGNRFALRYRIKNISTSVAA